MRITLTGGGTGGHVMPIVALISEIKSYFKDESVEFLWIGSDMGPERKIAKENNIPFKAVSSGKLRRYLSWQNIVDFFRTVKGFFQAYFAIRKFKPDVLFGKGGYVSVPAVLASYFLSVPSLIHESDVSLGLANKILLPYAKKIAVTFPETLENLGKYKDKGIVTGNPIRKDILKGNRGRVVEKYNLKTDLPVILIMGGSQGAEKINEAIIKSLPDLLEKYQIIHLCGDKNFNKIKDEVSGTKGDMQNYHLFPGIYGDDLADALACADLVISRAGLNSLFELALLGKPSVIIPYPHAAANHQVKNAEIFSKEKAIKLIKEEGLTSELLVNEIDYLFGNPKEMDNMGAEFSKIGNRINGNAGEKILKELLELKK
jgi:UDP-N-acetylglucosamine--N-acetylmuramyl-(pentapeptide) pyrophosphoryl-undecaprenol N-acetylglucosamine transferase